MKPTVGLTTVDAALLAGLKPATFRCFMARERSAGTEHLRLLSCVPPGAPAVERHHRHRLGQSQTGPRSGCITGRPRFAFRLAPAAG